jgi:hypothetical protein
MLNNHHKTHGLTGREYRKRYPDASTASANYRGICRDYILDRRAEGTMPFNGRLGEWTREQVILAIRAWAKAHDGRPPTHEQWQCAATKHPTSSTVQWHFGTWNVAIEAAGFQPRRKGWPERYSHCKRGHEFTPENTYTRNGERRCRICSNAAHRKRKKERYRTDPDYRASMTAKKKLYYQRRLAAAA